MNNNSCKNRHKSHGWLMMLACLLPILIIALLPLLGIKAGGLSGLAFLICPIMHIGMMFMMKSRNHSCHERNKSEDNIADNIQ